ncbi:glycosyltransferase family 2 protein [Butyrivibrio sp. NC3005]|uniref:glycosyltransferase family 2 protein n=1 Tax=Butyrivibrio sp. NC3005 TaxID=1280685 RepID=UPI00042472CB|nr:glycosyltransferase family 2 protein [Butyrivibrio sp. NC3005]
MKNKVTVSVIMPAYNTEDYIDQCIKSILNQTFTDFELLIVDDGSTDKTGEIIDYYADNDKRIKVFHHVNMGISFSRNFAIAKSIGDYICFIDSDDYIAEDYLENLYNAIVANNCKLSICEYTNFQDSEDFAFSDNKRACKVRTEDDILNFGLNHLEKNEYSVVCWNKMYSKSLWEGISFPEGKIFEDTYVWYKIFDKAGKAAIVDKVEYARRLNKASITHQKYSLKEWNMFDAKREQLLYFADKKQQRFIEISYNSMFYLFWCNYNKMKENNLFDKKVIEEKRNQFRECLRYIKVSLTFPLKEIVKQYYVWYLKRIK